MKTHEHLFHPHYLWQSVLMENNSESYTSEDALSHLLFFLILNSIWQSDIRRAIWSPYHSGDRSALMWKGSNWFCFNIFFPDHCHLLTLNLLYTGWNIYEFWLQNTFTTASIWINKGKHRFVRSLVCCGSRHRSISPPTSNSSHP